MRKSPKVFVASCLLGAVVFTLGLASFAHADCEVIRDGKKTPFDGHSLENLMVEKKSLIKLDKQFPKLNAVEKIFRGEVITCSNCTDNYLVCNN